MLEIIMIVCLIAVMALNVIALSYAVVYYDFFHRLHIPSVGAAVLAGILYVGTFSGAVYLCGKITKLPAFSKATLGEHVNTPLILFSLLVIQSVPALAIHLINQKTAARLANDLSKKA